MRNLTGKFMQKASLLFSLVALWPTYINAEHFMVTSDIWEPFFTEKDGKHYGIGVDILTEVFARTGDTYTIQTFPLRRAEWLFNNGEVDLMVIDSPLWNDPNNAHRYVFSDMFMHVQEYVYLNKKRELSCDSPEDLAGKIAGIRDGYRYPVFDKFFDEGVVAKYEADSDIRLINLLLINRIDAFFMDSVAFSYATKIHNVDQTLFSQEMVLSDTELGIKFTKENASVLPRINKAIAEMKKDGSIEQIISRYISQN